MKSGVNIWTKQTINKQITSIVSPQNGASMATSGHLCPEMHAIPNFTKITDFRNFFNMVFKTIFNSASCLTTLTKIEESSAKTT